MFAEEQEQLLPLFGANDLNDAAKAMYGQPEPSPQPARLPVSDERCHISVQKRALSVYIEAAAESGEVR